MIEPTGPSDPDQPRTRSPATLDEAPVEAPGEMSHREVLEALSGLLLAMFVAMLSSTVVTNALPRIVTDLHGSQTGYTWVVVATLLAMTASTPIWGKLADLFSKKLLVQSALVIYTVGSLIAALAPNMQVLIGARVVQGLGVGGLTALVQVVIASMVSPRERGRYAGYIGATFALATVSGPLIGGLIVDSPLGWRGTFFVGLPIAVAAFIVLQAKLHLPVVKRPVHDRLPRRHPDRRRRQHPARLGVPGRPAVRLDLRHERRDGRRSASRSSPPRCTSRRGSRSSRSSRCACSRTAPRRSPPWPPCSSASRCSARPSTSASTSRTPAA